MCLGRESHAPSSVYTESRAGDGRCTERTVFRVAPCYDEARQAANLQGNTLARCAISAGSRERDMPRRDGTGWLGM
jgi:hypothetical protein